MSESAGHTTPPVSDPGWGYAHDREHQALRDHAGDALYPDILRQHLQTAHGYARLTVERAEHDATLHLLHREAHENSALRPPDSAPPPTAEQVTDEVRRQSAALARQRIRAALAVLDEAEADGQRLVPIALVRVALTAGEVTP